MWIINIVPAWLAGSAIVTSIILWAIIKLLPVPQKLLLEVVLITILSASAYVLGIKHSDAAWQQKALVLEQRAEVAEAKSSAAISALDAKTAEKIKTIKEKVYVTKEVIRKVAGPQIDAVCTLPISSVVQHDASSQNTVATGTGATDGAPSGIAASKLLETVTENYGICHENAEKLKAWQQWYLEQKRIHEEMYR